MKRWLYGMRPAAAGWEKDCTTRLESVGFRRGMAAPTVVFNEETKVRVVVHGDDFTFAGTRRELQKMRKPMAEWYEIKDRGMMGSAADEVKEIVILGRTLRWKEGGLEYEADAKHVKELAKAQGLSGDSNTAVGPAVKWREEDKRMEAEELDISSNIEQVRRQR